MSSYSNSLSDTFSGAKMTVVDKVEMKLTADNVATVHGGLRLLDNNKLNKDDKPLITVITVVYNGADFIEETIKSVITQDYTNIEYIIVDGGSTDGTLDIIRKYDNVIDYWISEKDGGVYDAMNKAQLLSTGQFLNFMNAGDVFFSENVVSLVVDEISDKVSIIYGDAVVTDGCNSFFIKAKNFTRTNLFFWSTRTVCHQSIFVRRTIFSNYNLNYKLKAELDWYFEILKNNTSSVYINTSICVYALGGLSDRLFKLEMVETIKVLFSRNPFLLCIHLPVFTYKVLRRKYK